MTRSFVLLLSLFAGACTGAPVEDTGPAVTPEEICNGIDDDGDGKIDEDLLPTWYTDTDGDGYGPDATAVDACEAPENGVQVGGDCDDTDPAVSPQAVETCRTEGDDDCDGESNEADATGCVDTWADTDHDGYGAGDPTCVCTPAAGAATVDGDCAPTDPARNTDCSEE
jgi:hypothetical protein